MCISTSPTKRAAIYLDPDLHRAVRMKAVEIETSVSNLVNAALRQSLAEDADDLAAFVPEPGNHPSISRPSSRAFGVVASYRLRLRLYLKMLFGVLTWTPYTGRSTSCVTATLPARLTSW